MSKIREADLSELIPDNRNFNKHTEYGMHVLEKSIRQNKFGRSVLVDKNNRIIAGNGVVETAANIGETKIKVVETTGEELIVVKRTDIDLDSKQGREMALADNAVAAVDLQWDQDEITKAEEDFQIDASEWGVKFDAEAAKAEEDMKSQEESQTERHALKIDFSDEDSMRRLYLELIQRGFNVQICD